MRGPVTRFRLWDGRYADLGQGARERLARAFPALDVPAELVRAAGMADSRPIDPNNWFFDIVRGLSRRAGQQP